MKELELTEMSQMTGGISDCAKSILAGFFSGGAGGTISGAAIGTVIPGVGNLAGGILGGAYGAVSGALLGRANC